MALRDKLLRKRILTNPDELDDTYYEGNTGENEDNGDSGVTPSIPVYTYPSAPYPIPSADRIFNSSPNITVIDNVLDTKIIMGNEINNSVNPGWSHVTFPKQILEPHVVATSGVNSAKIEAHELRNARRQDIIVKMSTAAENSYNQLLSDRPALKLGMDLMSAQWTAMAAAIYLIVQTINLIIDALNVVVQYLGFLGINKLNKIVVSSYNTNMSDFIKTAFLDMSRKTQQLMFDLVIEPMKDSVTNSLVPDNIKTINDSWGIGQGRAIHQISIRNITETGFDYWHFGLDGEGKGTHLNWIAIGKTTEPITDTNRLKEEIQELKDYIKNVINPQMDNYDKILKNR